MIISENSKFSILLNKIVRRFQVRVDGLSEQKEISIVDHYTKQLRHSGYNHKQARDVVLSALKGILRKKENRSFIERKYKSGEEILEDRITNSV